MPAHQKTAFKLPYSGIDPDNDGAILYGDGGDFSMIFNIRNPALQHGADPEPYIAFHHVLLNIVKILGEGYIVQKQDIFSRKKYHSKPASEFLQQKYNDHFEGRDYTTISTYLIITRQVKKGAFYVYDKKALNDFRQHRGKLFDLLKGSGLSPHLLGEKEIHRYVTRILAMDFSSETVALNNLLSGDDQLGMGSKAVRNISLVNTDAIDLPEKVGTYMEKHDGKNLREFPVDNLSFLHQVPDFHCMLYNQVIEIPGQQLTLNKLELKRKRHSGVPDPANLMCVEDIDQLLVDVARENQLLVNSHFNIVVCAEKEKISKAANYIEAALFQQGIIPSWNAYNQLELFRCALPGNAVELKKYDWFLTTSDAALCFFFKEALPTDEPSDFLVRFTDRQGVPVAIDPADLPMRTNRINNRNKFVLGGSGSGKSFFMNALVEQYLLYNVDVVIIDTGHSYSGLNTYCKGKYITYSDQKPITMNPFQITEAEYNIEKKDFLCTLVSLLWKGAEGSVSSVERDVIANVISAYYSRYFNNVFTGIAPLQIAEIKMEIAKVLHEQLCKETGLSLPLDELLQDADKVLTRKEQKRVRDYLESETKNHEPDILKLFWRSVFQFEFQKRCDQEQKQLLNHFEQTTIRKLNFNSFYEFALYKIPEIKREERIPFDIDEFRYVLKKFYSGGEFEAILNEAADASLFNERFIVFEVDVVKEHKILFPIVTLIIMDVFIQKMRHRSHRRKALICEEAWKAIASPLMASYLLYLYKTVRKFWGEAIVVTQELSDILGNAVVKDSILNNSDTICLLDQSKFKENYDDIAKLLSLTTTEQKKIFTINQLDNEQGRGKFKEVYIRRGATGEVYGVEVSIFQYLCYTTEKPEKSAVEKYVTAYQNYPDALTAFVEDLRRSGLKLEAFVKQVNQHGPNQAESKLIKADFKDETIINLTLPG